MPLGTLYTHLRRVKRNQPEVYMTNIRIFEVGGSIRDELMGIDNPPDRDFCAVSPEGWEVLLAWCKSNMDKVFLVTPEFFTVRGMIG